MRNEDIAEGKSRKKSGVWRGELGRGVFLLTCDTWEAERKGRYLRSITSWSTFFFGSCLYVCICIYIWVHRLFMFFLWDKRARVLCILKDRDTVRRMKWRGNFSDWKVRRKGKLNASLAIYIYIYIAIVCDYNVFVEDRLAIFFLSFFVFDITAVFSFIFTFHLRTPTDTGARICISGGEGRVCWYCSFLPHPCHYEYCNW